MSKTAQFGTQFDKMTIKKLHSQLIRWKHYTNSHNKKAKLAKYSIKHYTYGNHIDRLTQEWININWINDVFIFTQVQTSFHGILKLS